MSWKETSKTPEPCLLLNLPTELRLQIYSYLWLSKPEPRFALRTLSSSVRFRPKGPFSRNIGAKSHRLPLWLLTSKQICREGLEELVRDRVIWAGPRVSGEDDMDGEGNGNGRGTPSALDNLLVVPFVTVLCVNLFAGGEDVGYFCWHDSPSVQRDQEFCKETHPRVHGWVSVDLDARVRRTYYFAMSDVGEQIFTGLLARGAPVREVRMACIPGASSQWAREDDREQGCEGECYSVIAGARGEDDEGDLTDWAARDIEDSVKRITESPVYGATWMGMDDWVLGVVPDEMQELKEETRKRAKGRWAPVWFRWKKRERGVCA